MHLEILAALAIAIFLGRALALFSERFRLPAVVGEISAGLLLGNLFLLWPGFGLSRVYSESEFLHGLSEMGVIILLFSVGLESSIAELKKVGVRAFIVAVVGVIVPLFATLGAWKIGLVEDRLPSGMASYIVPLFVGAAMTATSVGITARILSDVNKLKTGTGQLILNAAVIDDVLGLLILGAVGALASHMTGGAVTNLAEEPLWKTILTIVAKAVVFFGIILTLGGLFFGRLREAVRKIPQGIVTLGLVTCFGFAWLAQEFGLAAIVGSFFAGLLLDDKTDEVHHYFEPLVKFLAPLFFILIGASVKIDSFANLGWLSFMKVGLFVAIAIVGKMACSLVAGKGVDKIAVGLGMAPRGEVGLIFAAAGKSLGVFSDEVFGVLVFVVLLSTLIPSVLLDRWFRR